MPACLLPASEEEAIKVKDLCEQQPQVVFERMRELMAELLFLTDVVEDQQFEQNQEYLEALVVDFTQLVQLAVGRGLVMDQDE